MEAFGVLFVLALLGAVIILPIWFISAVLNLRRQAESDRQESTRRWQGLTARLLILETPFKELKQEAAVPRAVSPATQESISVVPAASTAEPPPPPRPVPVPA